jgi:hypothetical protein
VQTLWGSRILDIAVDPMPWIFERTFHVKILTFVLDENRLAAVINTVNMCMDSGALESGDCRCWSFHCGASVRREWRLSQRSPV